MGRWHRPASVPTRPRPQGGFTLLEAIVSLALVSTVVLALASGLLTSVRSSDSAKRTQEIDASLSSFAESIKTAPYPTAGGSCPTGSEFQVAYDAWPDRWSQGGVTTEVISAEPWDPSSGEYTSSCPGADPFVHLLTLRVERSGDGNSTTGKVVVAKR
jgi:Tfp pilus assembly protein PilV